MILESKKNDLAIKVEKNKEGYSIKNFLKKYYDFSSRLLKRLKKSKGVFLNNKNVSLGKSVFRDDVIGIVFPDESLNYEPENIELDIVYEDPELLVVNKPAFMVVHPTKSHKSKTLANAIAFYFKKNNINKKIRFINRLDMNTSGLVMIAKNSFGHQYVQKQMESGSIIKKYKAFIYKKFPYDEGEIHLPIGKKQKGDIHREVFSKGKNSLTKFSCSESYGDKGALLEVKLVTGRTHQIRVHLSHLGHCLYGDELYGGELNLINRQALHSFYLKLKTPRSNEMIECVSDLPKDLIKLHECLKGE